MSLPPERLAHAVASERQSCGAELAAVTVFECEYGEDVPAIPDLPLVKKDRNVITLQYARGVAGVKGGRGGPARGWAGASPPGKPGKH